MTLDTMKYLHPQTLDLTHISNLIPTLHTKASALHYLLLQPPTINSISQYNNTYFSSPANITHDDNEKYNTEYISRYNTSYTPRIKSTSRYIVDSGANQHTCNIREYFISFCKYTGKHDHVTLGDGKSTVNILGIATIKFTVGRYKIRLHNVFYVLSLDILLFSIKQHMKYVGCFVHSKNNTCTIDFPTLSFDAEIRDEI